MKTSRWMLIVVLGLVAPTVISPGCVAAEPQAASKISSPILLTAEAEAILDEWSGQPELLDAAAQKLHAAVRADPNYAKAYVQICRLQIMAGYRYNHLFEPLSLDTAEKAIIKAIQLDPRDGYAWVLKGHLYTEMGRLPEAKEALYTAEKIGTESPWLKLNWAALYDRERDYDRAADNYRAVIASGTTNKKALGFAYDELAGYYVMKHEWDKADEVHAQLIKLRPTNAWVRGNYAAALSNNGQFARAIPHAREALQLMDYGAARYTLAISLYGQWATMVMKGVDPKSAQPYLDEARSIKPDIRGIAADTYRYPATRVIGDALVQRGLLERSDLVR